MTFATSMPHCWLKSAPPSSLTNSLPPTGRALLISPSSHPELRHLGHQFGPRHDAESAKANWTISSVALPIGFNWYGLFPKRVLPGPPEAHAIGLCRPQ